MLRVGAGAMAMDGMLDGWMVEAGVTVPIWRDARSARREQASEARAIADAIDDGARRQIRAEVTRAYEMVRVARVRAEQLDRSVVPAAQAALDAAVASYAARGDLGPVLVALRALADLRVVRVDVTADIVAAEVMLSHAIGRSSHTFREVSP
jgi:outer membrane protein TolC